MSARTQQILCGFEDKTLAPYAVHAGALRGRRYSETSHPYRTEFQRDRDRILHSQAFRRLEYKTQVFLSTTGDHLRNRLTHTIEVAGIARTIARSLGLNEDLTEAIALAHDLGHTPFGHAGERALHSLMEGHGGFDHNLQAIRVVDLLEKKYPAYDGINLTWAGSEITSPKAATRPGTSSRSPPYKHPRQRHLRGSPYFLPAVRLSSVACAPILTASTISGGSSGTASPFCDRIHGTTTSAGTSGMLKRKEPSRFFFTFCPECIRLDIANYTASPVRRILTPGIYL